jgi:sterol desaturase/sphingolipid hydroxylase (fatty acid hydroxylase superfamily)
MTTITIAPSQPVVARGAQRSNRGTRVHGARTSEVYLPALSIPALALVLVGFGWSSGWGGAGFAGSLTSLRVVVIGPLALTVIGLIVVVERIWPAQPRPLIARGHRHDLLIAVIHATLVLPLVTALTLSFVEAVRRLAPGIVLPQMDTVPRWIALAAIIVAMDGCNWGVHLANHRVQMLWRFHELHHSQEDMNVLTVFRTHPLIHVSYLFSLLPGVVLLANGALSITVLALYGGIVAFAHSNTRLGFGPLGRIVVSPNFHRIHHKLDGPQDVNLGFALTIWDQLFGTAVFPT